MFEVTSIISVVDNECLLTLQLAVNFSVPTHNIQKKVKKNVEPIKNSIQFIKIIEESNKRNNKVAATLKNMVVQDQKVFSGTSNTSHRKRLFTKWIPG